MIDSWLQALVSLFNSKFFCVEAKFFPHRVRQDKPVSRQRPRSICEKSSWKSYWLLWSCRQGSSYGCLTHDMVDEIVSFWRIFHFHLLLGWWKKQGDWSSWGGFQGLASPTVLVSWSGHPQGRGLLLRVLRRAKKRGPQAFKSLLISRIISLDEIFSSLASIPVWCEESPVLVRAVGQRPSGSFVV